jgi:hypothetical protein
LADWTPDSTLHGHFWPSFDPTLIYPGVLTLERGQPRLVVTAPPIGQEVFVFARASTVHGAVISAEGETSVTLWDLADHHLMHEQNGTDHSRRFTHAIIGSHLDDHSQAAFAYSAARFHDLGEWGRFRTPVPIGTPDEELPQHSLAHLDRPYRDLFDREYSVTVRLEYPGRVETSDRFPHGAIINHQDEDCRVVFEVDPPAPPRFHELLLLDFQALLTFCYQSGAPVGGQWVGAQPTNLWPVLMKDSFRDRAVLHLGHFQLLLSPTECSFGELVERWWAVVEGDFPAPQVVTTYFHGSRGLLEQSTASALAATENIHERVGSTLVRVAPAVLADYKRRIRDAFPGTANAQFRSFLHEKMQDNRPTLDTRLSELTSVITLPRMETLGIDPGEWRQLFKRVRNKLAHTGAHVHRRGDPSDDLELINAQTRAILTLLIMIRMRHPSAVLDHAARVLSEYPHRSW